MTTNQLPKNIPDVQAAIYRVALALDSFLLNGLPYGVVQRAMFPGFLEKEADGLLTSLAVLENDASEAPAFSQPQVTEALAALRGNCRQLIDLVTGLGSYRTLPLPQLRAALSQIPILRGECVRRLQELEGDFQTPQRFYPSRPSHSAAMVNGFLANLEQLFEEERAAPTV